LFGLSALQFFEAYDGPIGDRDDERSSQLINPKTFMDEWAERVLGRLPDPVPFTELSYRQQMV
jgi:hypothetical protein